MIRVGVKVLHCSRSVAQYELLPRVDTLFSQDCSFSVARAKNLGLGTFAQTTGKKTSGPQCASYR